MKKLISFALVVCLLLSCAACGTDQPAAGNDPTSAPTDAPTDPSPTAPEPTVPTDSPANPDPDPNPELTLSDDWKDFTFQLGNKVYQFPCTPQDFADNGWILAYGLVYPDTIMSGYSHSTIEINDQAGFEFSAEIINNTPRTLVASECLIYNIHFTIDFSTDGWNGIPTSSADKLKLAGGISYSSTMEEIKNAWGEPSYSYNNEYGTSATYEAELDGVMANITVSFETRDGMEFMQIYIGQSLFDIPMIPEPEYKNVNIYTYSPESWGAPNCWAWENEGEDAYETWPGQAMTANGQFYVTQAPEWVNCVIINGNNGAIQTEDIPVEMGKDVWVIIHNDGTTNYSLFYSEPTDADLAAAGY